MLQNPSGESIQAGTHLIRHINFVCVCEVLQGKGGVFLLIPLEIQFTSFSHFC